MEDKGSNPFERAQFSSNNVYFVKATLLSIIPQHRQMWYYDCDMFILGILWWVFAILVILAIAVIASVEEEKPLIGFLSLVGAAALVHFTNTFDMMNVAREWPHYLLLVGYYIAAGVGWCVAKWWFYTDAWGRTQRQIVQNVRKEFLDRLGLKGDSIPDEHRSAWELWVVQHGRPQPGTWSGEYSGLTTGPSNHPASTEDIHVKNNWNKFGVWGMYWPFSMLWTLIDDPLKRIFKFIIMNILGGALQSFANRATSGVAKEINK